MPSAHARVNLSSTNFSPSGSNKCHLGQRCLWRNRVTNAGETSSRRRSRSAPTCRWNDGMFSSAAICPSKATFKDRISVIGQFRPEKVSETPLTFRSAVFIAVSTISRRPVSLPLPSGWTALMKLIMRSSGFM